ncbi:MAG: hypothetical protein IKZ91_04425 [Bacteroidales bacterium]|nr:hypothetical protein [Bacteroidales bacterium]
MKKLLIILALFCFAISANAQRRNIDYVSAGVVLHVDDTYDLYPGIDLAYGFRNYNREAFVSFAYGAEGYAYWLPSGPGTSIGIYGIPQIGVVIGPSNFKIYPHWGLMAGYSSGIGRFNTGSNGGLAFDIGRNVSFDFSAYYIFGRAWTTSANFIWRFGK